MPGAASYAVFSVATILPLWLCLAWGGAEGGTEWQQFSGKAAMLTAEPSPQAHASVFPSTSHGVIRSLAEMMKKRMHLVECQAHNTQLLKKCSKLFRRLLLHI